MTFIYTLSDGKDIRYVGKTKYLNKRLGSHKNDILAIWQKMMNRKDSEFFRAHVDWEGEIFSIYLYLLSYSIFYQY